MQTPSHSPRLGIQGSTVLDCDEVAIVFVVACIHRRVGFIEHPLVDVHQAGQNTGTHQEDAEEDAGHDLVGMVLLAGNVFGLLLNFRSTLGPELDEQHKARGEEEGAETVLHTENRSLSPQPHPLILIESGCFVETGGPSSHQPDGEEQLKR